MTIHFNKIKNLIRGFIVFIAVAGCQNFYKASPINVSHTTAKSIDSLKQQNMFFILRNGYYSYYMKDISLSSDNKTLNTTLETLPSDHRMYPNKDRNGKMEYKKSDSNDLKVFAEVHLYIAPDSNITIGNYVLQPDNIQKIELIKKDKAKTNRSYLLGTMVSIGVSVAIIAIFVVALSTRVSVF